MNNFVPKKILIFSLNPLFPNLSIGGAQKQLKKVALHLGELGHQVTILCSRHPNHANDLQQFTWHENVTVLPQLRFKQPFPEPYFTPLYNIANTIRTVGHALLDADVHYSHDGGLIFPYVVQDIPTVISLRSILFGETLQSAFLFQGDALILPSEHTHRSYQAVLGQFAPAIKHRMHVIHNGFDWEKYQPTPPKHILESVPPEIIGKPIVLFPHRPEVAKGIYQAIDVAEALVNKYGWDDLVVLTPKWLDAETVKENRTYYDAIQQRIHDKGLANHFVTHDWIGDDTIAEYYSLASVTLAIGNYVETFGNTVFESLGCGTPVIASRVATYRDLLPDAILDKVDYGDIATTARLANQILKEKQRTSAQTMDYLHTHYSLDGMVEQYADIILNARKLPPLTYQVPHPSLQTRFSLAPWCYINKNRVYHDFIGDYYADDALTTLAHKFPQGFTANEATQVGVGQAQLATWIDEGFLVPDYSQNEVAHA